MSAMLTAGKIKRKYGFPIVGGQDFSEAIINTMDDPMVILDKFFSIKSANNSFYRKFHVRKETAEGKVLFELDPEKWNIPELRQMMNDIFLKDSDLYGFEVTHIFPQLRQKIMLLKGRIIKNNSLQKLVLLTIEDITDCTQSYINEKELLKRDIHAYKADKVELEEAVKRRTQQLDQKNVELESLFQNATMGIVVINSKGEIVKINPRAERKFGYGKEELTGEKIDVLIPKLFSGTGSEHKEKDRPEPNNLEMGVPIEFLGVKKDGKEFPVEVSLSPYTTYAGNFIIAFIVDITIRKRDEMTIINKTKELKRSHKILKSKNTSLEKMNKELETFTYISSHDLQEPLRKIKTFVNLLLNSKETFSEESKHYLQKTHETANRMQVLIEDLLAYSRAKNAERNFEKTDLNKIVDEVLSDFREAIAEKNAIVKYDDLCEATIIPFQFSQLLHNLISNSIKFSHPKRRLKITIKSKTESGSKLENADLSPEKEYCHITVADNGIGFDPQYKDRIFEVFQRLHPVEEYQGTGIGLAICKRIVENHKGFIRATSKPNKGAIFEIYLPA